VIGGHGGRGPWNFHPGGGRKRLIGGGPLIVCKTSVSAIESRQYNNGGLTADRCLAAGTMPIP
jgi:hypothetical protein